MHKHQLTRVERQLTLAEQTNEWLQQGDSEREQAEGGQRRVLAAKEKALAEALQATHALQKERDLISAILDTVGALVVILNRDGQIVRFNRACEQMTGYSFDEVKGRCVWDLFLTPEEVEPVKAVFEKLQAGQFPNKYENYWVAKDGSRRLIAWSNTALLDSKGLVEYVIGTGIDIEIERRRAEQFRLINQVGRHITSILTVNELLEEITHLLKETMGYYLVGIALIEKDELVFKAGSGAIWETPDFQPPCIKIGQEGITGWVAHSGEPLLVSDVSQEARYYSLPQASEIQSELAVPLKVKDRVIGVLHAQSDRLDDFDDSDLAVLQSLAHQAAIAIENARLYEQAQQELAARKQAESALQKAHDELELRVRERTSELKAANEQLQEEITERKRAEEGQRKALAKALQATHELQESEEKYRVLVEHSLQGLAIAADSPLRLVFANTALAQMLGYTPNELTSLSPKETADLVHPDDQALFFERFRYRLDKGTGPASYEYRAIRKDGAVRWLEVSASRIEYRGQPAVQGAFVDITERKQAEAALHRYTDRLSVLHKIDQGILSAQSPDAIAHVALGHIRQLIPCQRASVTLFDFTTDEGILLASDVNDEVESEESARVSLEPFADEIEELQQGKVVIRADPQPQEKNPAMLPVRTSSVVLVPLAPRGELIGVLNLTATAPDVFTAEHIDIAREMADQLAIAIQQARLREQVQHHTEELEQCVADRTRELSALYEVTAVASQSLDLETTLSRSLERVLAAMKSDAGAIRLLDEEGETLNLIVQQGIPPDVAAQIETLPSNEGLGGWVVEHGEPLIVPDMTFDPRLIQSPMTFVGVPMRASGQIVGVLSVLREAMQPQFGSEEIALLTSIADQVGTVVESARLRQLAQQAAVMEERQRLARDLHDSVTQTIFSMTLTAEAARILLDRDPAGVADQLARLQERAQAALAEMRSLIYELRPITGAEEGLFSALRQHVANRQEQDGLAVALHLEGKERLPPEYEAALFRIVQEALNNVVKHAQTGQAEVTLRLTDESASLVIKDHGVGYDPVNTGSETPHLGLASMRERTEALNGTFAIESQPGVGTCIRVEVPRLRRDEGYG